MRRQASASSRLRVAGLEAVIGIPKGTRPPNVSRQRRETTPQMPHLSARTLRQSECPMQRLGFTAFIDPCPPLASLLVNPSVIKVHDQLIRVPMKL